MSNTKTSNSEPRGDLVLRLHEKLVLKEIEHAQRLLPGWFVPRMMGDAWFFGLKLNSGEIIAIETILAVNEGSHGDIWIDVRLLLDPPKKIPNIFIPPCGRQSASINAKFVALAFELADT
ncbi:MAG: hypothetical protein HW380_3711 [Magnetococcales bacterium]|nr:hypothetical protein [Magnetococcales bacterium]HIJ85702.1 hypothetical protein [Magnetococcales bacterium]